VDVLVNNAGITRDNDVFKKMDKVNLGRGHAREPRFLFQHDQAGV